MAKFVTAYGPRERLLARPPSGRSRVKQSFRDECDIVKLMGRYAGGQQIDHLVRHGARYGIVPSETLHEMLNIVGEAGRMFADLPAELRERFGQSPDRFLAYVQDEKNLDEMRKLGLADPAKEPPEEPAIAAARAHALLAAEAAKAAEKAGKKEPAKPAAQ